MGHPGRRFSTGQTYNSGTCTEFTSVVTSSPVFEQTQISCPQTLDSPIAGTKMRRRRQEAGRFMCPLCQCTFASKAGLKGHVTHVHQKLAKYLCETCGKGYSVRSNYMDHIATHSGTRRHVCSMCQRQFTFKHSLKSHMLRFHTNKTM